MKPAASSKKKAAILGILAGGFVFWWYSTPFPWLGGVMGLFVGLFTFCTLNTSKMERLRRPFFIGLAIVVLVTLAANILWVGYRSFLIWVEAWHAGYYLEGAAQTGTALFPLPLLVPSIFLGKAEFLLQDSVWLTGQPTSLASFFLFMIPYFLTLIIFERAFCGWVCPLGALPEAMVTGNKERWSLSFLKKTSTATSGFRIPNPAGITVFKGWVEWVKYGFLILLILLSFLVPFSIVNIITPALWVKSIPIFWIGIVLIIVLAIVLPFMTKRRVWCHVLCPVGTALSLLHKISLFRITIDKMKCNECMDCVQECRSYSLTPEGVERGGPMSGNCIRCARCIEACPEDAIDITWLGKKRLARAPFITLIIITAVCWYLWFAVLLVSYASKLSEFSGL